jgi:5'(3')-deoxyribonucleotidase
MTNKIIALDVDGVVADLLTNWLRWYNRDYNDDLKYTEIVRWETWEFTKPECGTKILEYLKNPRLYDDVLPMPGALDAIAKLRMNGYRVIYATVTPIETTGVKYAWLERYNLIEHMKDYIEVTDKGLIRASVLVDDRAENLGHFIGAKILFDQPWNRQGVSNKTHYAHGWQEVVDIIQSKV